MSYITRGRHTVTVRPGVPSEGSIGQTEWTYGDPVTVQCNVHLATSSEVVSFGTREFVDGTISIYPPNSWTFDEHCLITFNGVDYDQDGLPVQAQMSMATTHQVVQIRRRSKVVS